MNLGEIGWEGVGLDSSGSEWSPVAGFIKGGEFLDSLCDFQLVKDSALVTWMGLSTILQALKTIIRLIVIINMSAWSRVLLEKLMVAQFLKKLLTFYGTETENAAGPYSDTVESSANPHIVSLNSILILFSSLRLALKVVFFPSHFTG